MNILIVDDKDDARYLLTALLEGHGHRVTATENGEQALAAARRERPDLIISDILMPVMDGFRLCQEIRRDGALKDTRFVFYTATYTQEEDARFAAKIGADDFIQKPAEPDVFMARIEAAVDATAQGVDVRTPETDDEVEVLRLYSERLVAKLEKRSLDLQEELARRQKAEESLRRHAKRLEVLRSVDIAILEARSPTAIAEIALEAMESILMVERASVVSFDLAPGQGTVLAVRSAVPTTMVEGDTLPITTFGDLGGLEQGHVQRVDDLSTQGELAAEDRQLLEAGIRSIAVVPLRARGELIGCLNLGFASPNEMTDEAIQAAAELANQVAIGMRQAELRQEVERHAEALESNVHQLSRALSQTVHALAAAAEVRDPYTAGHQRRVTELAVAIASTLGLSPHRIEGLRVAGLMHDIGKLAVPSELLSKPTRLTDVEYRLIRSHPETACDILGTVDFPWPIPEIVIQHHERLDGSGYPNGLRGDEILLEARILAVSDVVEAMASHRPYRPARGIDEAIAEIRDGAGTRYDETVVDACVDLLESGRFAFTESG